MARVILEGMGDAVTVGGPDVDVIGTNNDETVTIVSGNVTLDASFANGGDTIELAGEAEQYSAVLSGSRVIITNIASGATVSIPVGTEGLTVEFGGDDARVLMIEDGAVMFGGTAITTTEATLEAGDDDASALTAALQQLQGAQAALDAFLDSQPANLDTEAEIDANLQNLSDELDTYPTAAQVAASVTSAQADVDAVEEEIAEIEGLAAAIAKAEALAEEVEELDAARELAQAEELSAIAFYNSINDEAINVQSNGTATLADGTPLIILNAEEELVLNPELTTDRGDTQLLAAVRTSVEAEGDYFDALGELTAAQEAVEALDPENLYGTLQARQETLENAENLQDARAELAQDVADAQDLADTLDDLQDDVSDAIDAIEDLGFEAPQTVDDMSLTSGTAENDIFVLATGDGTGSATIDDFGAEGDDVLFIGGNTYTVVNIDADVDVSNTDVGNVGVLEVFVQQDGDNTIMYFEDETFSGSASNNSFQGFTLTLNDVDASNVSFDSTGYISLDDSAMMA
ncbi:hypothetical protein [Croceicoccus sp. YJ47]|uniref:hypothetical protein n=1 Tax=Croceicoccus sp. YJ47 TaxID=2798724 RepID=UPI001920419D|nr:hypothetical protein [Croceicoccus sp. YJ47]QQN75457.1 hypothetical protein JD971_07500 [Croceicoccus sp. YJ47]